MGLHPGLLHSFGQKLPENVVADPPGKTSLHTEPGEARGDVRRRPAGGSMYSGERVHTGRHAISDMGEHVIKEIPDNNDDRGAASFGRTPSGQTHIQSGWTRTHSR